MLGDEHNHHVTLAFNTTGLDESVFNTVEEVSAKYIQDLKDHSPVLQWTLYPGYRSHLLDGAICQQIFTDLFIALEKALGKTGAHSDHTDNKFYAWFSVNPMWYAPTPTC